MANYKKFPLVKTFNLDNNNSYVYDGRQNLLLKLSSKEVENVLAYMNNSENTDDPNGSSIFENSSKNGNLINLLQNQGVLIPGPLDKKIDNSKDNIDQLINFADKNAIPRKLALEITDKCNLRCKYCSYTYNEKTNLGKMHGNSVIKFTDAKEAIKLYFNSYIKTVNQIPQEKLIDFVNNHPPIIGFYGGEALIHFELLKKIINYTFSLPWKKYIDYKKIQFSITTNGTLLNKNIISFCIENDVFLYISIDGPPEENDKYRVYKNGRGSGNDVIKNLSMVKELSPDYYENKVILQAVQAPNYNREIVHNFFMNYSDEKKFAGVSIFNYLEYNDPKGAPADITPDLSFSISNFLRNNYNSKDLFKKIDFEPEIQEWLKNLYELLISINIPPSGEIFGSCNSCYIGYMGLFVSAKGELHMCERTDFSLPIGNVKEGIKKNLIHNLYSKYFEVINSPKCKSCWMHAFCPLCIATMIKDKTINQPSVNQCINLRKTWELKFKDLILITANYPKVIEYMQNRFGDNDSLSIDEFLSKN